MAAGEAAEGADQQPCDGCAMSCVPAGSAAVDPRQVGGRRRFHRRSSRAVPDRFGAGDGCGGIRGFLGEREANLDGLPLCRHRIHRRNAVARRLVALESEKAGEPAEAEQDAGCYSRQFPNYSCPRCGLPSVRETRVSGVSAMPGRGDERKVESPNFGGAQPAHRHLCRPWSGPFVPRIVPALRPGRTVNRLPSCQWRESLQRTGSTQPAIPDAALSATRIEGTASTPHGNQSGNAGPLRSSNSRERCRSSSSIRRPRIALENRKGTGALRHYARSSGRPAASE